MPDNLISISVPPTASWLSFLQDSLHHYGKMAGFSDKLDDMLVRAVTEAMEELYTRAREAGVSDRVALHLNFKGEAVVVDIEYNGRIPLNPLTVEDYDVPDGDSGPDDVNMEAFWLHMIKREMDRVFFMVKGQRRVLRMVKYHRDKGREQQAWIMSVKPALKRRVLLLLDDPGAEFPSSTLQNPGGGALKLGPGETFIVRGMDGKTSFHDIYMAHIDAMGLTSPESLAALYEKLESMKMLAEPGGESREKLVGRITRGLLNPSFSIPRADGFITTLYGKTRFLHGYAGLSLMLAAGLSGLIPLVKNWEYFKVGIGGLEQFFLSHPRAIAGLYILCLVHVFLHEIGHGLVCKHYGGRVPRLGFMFYLAMFIFYCDTTAAYNFPEKKQRIMVSLGGPLISFAIFGAGLWAAGYYAGTGSIWENIFVAFSLFNLFGLVMNFNPFIKMDSYYMLLDYTGIPNLRRKSFRFLREKILDLLGWGKGEDIMYSTREQKIFWWYGILGGAVTVFFLAMPFLHILYHMKTHSLHGGRMFLAFFVVFVLAARLGHAAFHRLRAVWYRDYTIP